MRKLCSEHICFKSRDYSNKNRILLVFILHIFSIIINSRNSSNYSVTRRAIIPRNYLVQGYFVSRNNNSQKSRSCRIQNIPGKLGNKINRRWKLYYICIKLKRNNSHYNELAKGAMVFLSCDLKYEAQQGVPIAISNTPCDNYLSTVYMYF